MNDKFQNNELDRSMQLYYRQRAAEYDDWYDRQGRYNDPRTNAAWHAQVAELGQQAARFGGMLARRPGLYALDLACGTGKWSPYWVQSLHGAGRLVAFDHAVEMLDLTRQRLAEIEPEYLERTLVVQGDAYALPFAAASFDLVFTGFWLSHVPSERLDLFLTELKRVLKPDGNWLIFDSALREGVTPEGVARRTLDDGSAYDVFKINYTPRQLEALLKRNFSTASARQTRDYFLIGQATR